MGLRPTSPTRPITPDCPRNKHSSRFGMWQKFQSFFNRDGSLPCMNPGEDANRFRSDPRQTLSNRDGSVVRPVGIGLPRQATFKRQNSEKRDRLCLVEPLNHERRAYSMSRPGSKALNRLRSNSVPTTSNLTRCSAPALGNTIATDAPTRHRSSITSPNDTVPADAEHPVEYERVRPLRPASPTSSTDSFNDQRDYVEDRSELNRELDTKWILNLSMHFRDKSDREKFFVTYAETPSRWRRLTVSCDYRSAEQRSLEHDLKELQLQRDKSMQIYEAIRDSLEEINFFDTVTNLKLETSNGRLHVHVTEDVNEIIPYPPIDSLQHLLNDDQFRPKKIRESELSFEAHLSGFVYKVTYKGIPYIKKEIPGPDTIDEFLYEVNALHALQRSRHVISLEGIVTDENGQTIKGLLINYAERGAVVDLLYDYKSEISWQLRERWARHAIQGLSDIHEEGYVQGDFTLSNIVVDGNNNAKIIDINRRGCPVGWEPPEIAKKIASNQKISMYIGQKSDLYQLGMTLWALAMDDDEPERHDPPLSTQEFPTEVPIWYQDIVRNCLSTRPRDRLSATELLGLILPERNSDSWSSQRERPHVRIRTEKQYIDPASAVERDDLERYRAQRPQPEDDRFSPESSRDDHTFTWPQSSSHDREYDSADSLVERPRGRRRISDHDRDLQAQRRHEITLVNETEIDGTHGGSTPIITISSDGTMSHMANVSNSGPELEGVTLDDTTRDTSPLGLSSSIPDFQHLSDGRSLFLGYSDASDDTPRHSNVELFDTVLNDLGQDASVSHRDNIHDDLAGMGTHPRVSEDSLEQVQHELERVRNEDCFTIDTASVPFENLEFDAHATNVVDSENRHDGVEIPKLQVVQETDCVKPTVGSSDHDLEDNQIASSAATQQGSMQHDLPSFDGDNLDAEPGASQPANVESSSTSSAPPAQTVLQAEAKAEKEALLNIQQDAAVATNWCETETNVVAESIGPSILESEASGTPTNQSIVPEGTSTDNEVANDLASMSLLLPPIRRNLCRLE